MSKTGGGLTKNEVHFDVLFMFYLLVLQVKGPIHCMPPEILDIVHDIYGYYAMQKSRLSVTLAAGIDQQGSVQSSYLYIDLLRSP